MRLRMERDALYREVTEKHGATLARFAAGYDENAAHGMELLRDMHASIWKSLALFDHRTPVRTWVFRVAHNVGASHLVRHTGMLRFGDLRPLDRQVRLLFQEGLDVLAIAEITGLSPSDVALRVHRRRPVTNQLPVPFLPTAFTLTELQERGVEAGAGETNKFLERLLTDRRSDQLFRLAGGVLLIPLLFLIRPAMAHSATLLIVVAMFGGGLFLASRQALVLGATTRALAAVRVPDLPRFRWQPSIWVVGSLALAGVLFGTPLLLELESYGERRAHERRREEAVDSVTHCLDPRNMNDPKCVSVLGDQRPAVQAPIAQLPVTPNCDERRNALLETAELGTREMTFLEAVTLGDECPREFVLPPPLLRKKMLSEVTEKARKGCFDSDKEEALYRCEIHARLECPGKSAAWRERNEAFLKFLSLRSGQASQQPWACVDSPVVGMIRALETSTPETVSITSFEELNGASKISGEADDPSNVEQFAHKLEDVVKTSRGLGRVVARDGDGDVRVELFGSHEGMELANGETTKLFTQVETTSVIREVSGSPEAAVHLKFVVTLNINRAALPSGREYLVPYVPDVMVEHYGALVRAEPENAEAWLSLAYARKAQNKPESAVAAFKKYIELRPETPQRKELENQMYLLGGQ